MYTMKNISKYLGVGLLLLAAACSQTQDGTQYTPNKDDAKAIHFIQSSIEKEFAQGTQNGVIEVEIARPGNKGAYTVYLTTKGANEKIFKVPTEVTIPDGKHAVTVPVEIDLAQFIMGSSYKTTLYISEREVRPGDNSIQVSQYSDKVTLSASLELEWETLYRINNAGETIPQLATYHYNGYYTGRDSGLEVEKAIGANIYRLKDWASGVTFKFIVHDDNTCTVPAQSIGYFNSNYNEYVFVSDMAIYTGSDAAYASYPCTFDGKNSFSFYLIYYVSGGYFAQGTEQLVFDIDSDTTPIVDISFEGIETTTTGFQAPKLHFSPNSYTKFYKATVVAGDITTDTAVQDEVRAQLIEDKLEAVTPVVTLFEDNETVWNVPKGNYTAVALAYDSIDNPCKLYMHRFTCDPKNEYSVEINTLNFYTPENNPNYSPYTSLVWEMQTNNLTRIKYLCLKKDIADYLCEALDQTLEELTETRAFELNEETVAAINSEEGFATAFTGLDEGGDYLLCLLIYNSFGDQTFILKTASTFGRTFTDFDQTKNFSDFIGAFSTTATIEIGSNKGTEKTFRMDITPINERDVIINGMSDMRDFAPQLKGYYDKEKHMIIVEAQSTGAYKTNYTSLGFSDGMSIYWGGVSMAIGYIGDRLYWVASPFSSAKVNSYMFLLFNSPLTNGSSYLREYVGAKTYSSISMIPLQLAPTQPTAQKSAAAMQYIEAGGQQCKVHLLNPASVKTAMQKAPAATTPIIEGKRLRTDLVLHTR